MSLLEIYNETIRDLIQPREEEAAEEKRLDVKIAPEGGTCVPGISIMPVWPALPRLHLPPLLSSLLAP